MGLFNRKKSAKEEKINELVGGFGPSQYLKKRMEELELIPYNDYWVYIQRKFKEMVKQNDISIEKLEITLDDLINEKINNFKESEKINQKLAKCKRETPNDKETIKKLEYLKNQKKIEEKEGKNDRNNKIEKELKAIEQEKKMKQINLSRKKEISEEKIKITYLLNQTHNKIYCSKCNSELINSDKFCYNCGNISSKIIPKINIDINTQIKEVKKKESENHNNDLKGLESLYNQRIQTKEDVNFKFGFILFLEDINKNPCKKNFAQYYEYDYDLNTDNLRKIAIEEKYIELGNPILNLKSSTVSDIKEVLRKYKLKVSGRKQELIDRIETSLDESKIKKEFPGNSYVLTDKGKKYISKNNHVSYYHKRLKNNLDLKIERYDLIFQENNNKHESALILINENMKNYIRKRDWGLYGSMFLSKAYVYEDLEDVEKTLDSYIKVFICDINLWDNGSYFYLNRIYLIPSISEKINSLLVKLNLPMEELKNKYDKLCESVKIPVHTIPEIESFKYLIRQFNGEDPEELSIEIRNRYNINNDDFYSYDEKTNLEKLGKEIRSKFK